MSQRSRHNVLGSPLAECCRDPVTGAYRDGSCRTGPGDPGLHTVCAILTDEFLAYTRERGNDLATPRPEFDFPGLSAGDRWCLCAARWAEAEAAGVAPPVVLEACSIETLTVIDMDTLRRHALQ